MISLALTFILCHHTSAAAEWEDPRFLGEGLEPPHASMVGLPLLSACALHYRTEDLDGPRHLFEVRRVESVVLNLDLKQMGVGGDNGWGARPHDAFTIPCAPCAFRFRLRPFAEEDADPRDLAREAPPALPGSR